MSHKDSAAAALLADESGDMVQSNGEPIHSSRNYDRYHKISPRYFCVTARELDKVEDIILNPPAEKPYTALRNRLCSQYADSEE
ncbi:hypothetical protein NPIL_191 [Nephila pilipes]|uniref:Uncharacterized protein n=1 Tax=Nephila pilipes TaxID=299642 RepID=A0A8X6QPQ8_NEPPI|nr:hypothetical protein NPIL_191 [Nephila pilipes]